MYHFGFDREKLNFKIFEVQLIEVLVHHVIKDSTNCKNKICKILSNKNGEKFMTFFFGNIFIPVASWPLG